MCHAWLWHSYQIQTLSVFVLFWQLSVVLYDTSVGHRAAVASAHVWG